MDYKALLEELLEQERELQFVSFSNEDAWQLGALLVQEARTRNVSVTIDIIRHGQQLFHYALAGTTLDNDYWIQRKNRVVNRFCHSSHYMGMKLKSEGRTIEAASLLPESEFAPHGGSFPIVIKDTGVIGTITVSGLPSAEDHQLVVDTTRKYLSSKLVI